MEQLELFVKKTEQLLLLLEDEKSFADREQFISQVNQIIGERDDIINHLPSLATLIDNQVRQDILHKETRIKILISGYFDKIKNDLKKLQLQKRKNIAYSNPYGNLSADGMFLDKKK
ncbi:hypothetical protein CVD28_09400 [Bacillus sp. M6-12]|nr:hypothetical protein CVD28_09400 [Bacillus sp. M6-12]